MMRLYVLSIEEMQKVADANNVSTEEIDATPYPTDINDGESWMLSAKEARRLGVEEIVEEVLGA